MLENGNDTDPQQQQNQIKKQRNHQTQQQPQRQSKPIAKIKNQHSLKQLSEQQKWPEIKKIRASLAVYSIKKAMIRNLKQKQFDQNFDQLEAEELFDQRVSRGIAYEEQCSHYADSAAINKGRFSLNGKLYGTVGSAGEGRVWNTDIAMRMGTSTGSGFTEQISLLKTDVKLCDITFHPKIGQIPAFAPNICTSSSNGQLLFWTFDPTLPQQKSFKINANLQRINSIDYHPSGSQFLSSSYDQTFTLWDSARLKSVYSQKGHQKQIHTACLHTDGSLYFTGDLAGCGQIWDLRTGKGVYQIKETDSILCCDFNPNGYQLAVGGKSNMITIKDIRRKKTVRSIPAHTKLISGLKYSQNQAVLASVSHDNELKLWHGRSYISVNLEQMTHSSKVTSVDCCNGMIGTTTIERKWVMWMLKGYEDNANNDVKIQNVQPDQLQQ